MMLKSCAHRSQLKFLILRGLGDFIRMFYTHSVFNSFPSTLYHSFLTITIEDKEGVIFFPHQALYRCLQIPSVCPSVLYEYYQCVDPLGWEEG